MKDEPTKLLYVDLCPTAVLMLPFSLGVIGDYVSLDIPFKQCHTFPKSPPPPPATSPMLFARVLRGADSLYVEKNSSTEFPSEILRTVSWKPPLCYSKRND